MRDKKSPFFSSNSDLRCIFQVAYKIVTMSLMCIAFSCGSVFAASSDDASSRSGIGISEGDHGNNVADSQMLLAANTNAVQAASGNSEEKKEPEKPKPVAGDFFISINDDEGNSVTGVKIMLYLPGNKNKSLEQQPNSYYEITDGDKNDKDGENNGTVLLTQKQVSASVGKKCGFRLRINHNKYLPYNGKGTCSADKPNLIAVELKKIKSKEKSEKQSNK